MRIQFHKTETSILFLKIGPIPTDDGVGKEVITRMTANMVTNREFYTDSNGRDFLKRVTHINTNFLHCIMILLENMQCEFIICMHKWLCRFVIIEMIGHFRLLNL